MMLAKYLIVIALLTLLFNSSCTHYKINDLLMVHHLRVEYKESPYIDIVTPRFSWQLQGTGRNRSQGAYQILVASSETLLAQHRGDVWDSNKHASTEMSQVVYRGKPLVGQRQYFWKIRSWDENDVPSQWSKAAMFETAFLSQDAWQAKWIGYDLTDLGKGELYHLPPAPYVRKEIQLNGKIKSARLYTTALGLFDFFINGEKVGDDYLNPGWTNYHKRVHYQVYDVKDYLTQGENTLGSILSYGWYAGYVGYAKLTRQPKEKGFYGDVPKLLAQMEVTYENGKTERFISDDSWKASAGPITETDILQGETYDARRKLIGWSNKDYDDAHWDQVKVYDVPGTKVELHPGMPIRAIDRIKPINVTKRDDGYLFDFGQNFAGIVHLKVRGKSGETVQLKYGEMLHPDGGLMTENLRMARATDNYTLNGDKEGETWQPRFTFHGFRYVQMSGYNGIPDMDTLTGLVLSSDHESTSTFNCGNDMVNQLFKNINWSQVSNFLDIPSDCPQRDERQGWTGDAQVYMRSALINRDVASFFTKWLKDLNDDQWATGAYPNFAPTPYIRPKMAFSPGWMEAGIICPFELYSAYGDTRVVAQHWDSMVKFMDFCTRRAGDDFIFAEASFEDITPKGGFGDWLSIGKKTPPDLLATFYYAYSAQLMSEMATAIGKDEKATYYQTLFGKIKQGVIKHYQKSDGTFQCNESAYRNNGAGYVDGQKGFSGHTQTAYANALYIDLFDKAAALQAGENLATLIKQNDGKLSTGFLGAKSLLPALSKSGHSEVAYDLFLKTEYPSLGFEVVNGATTIWERWDSYTHEKGFGGKQNAGMNSFNHYAFGAVCEWMYEYAAGIKCDAPAYKTVVIKPEPDKRLGYLNASYQSISGTIKSSWTYQKNGLLMAVSLPVNVKGKIYIPCNNIDAITENGKGITEVASIEVVAIEDGHVVIHVGSGDYSFFVAQQ